MARELSLGEIAERCDRVVAEIVQRLLTDCGHNRSGLRAFNVLFPSVVNLAYVAALSGGRVSGTASSFDQLASRAAAMVNSTYFMNHLQDRRLPVDAVVELSLNLHSVGFGDAHAARTLGKRLTASSGSEADRLDEVPSVIQAARNCALRIVLTDEGSGCAAEHLVELVRNALALSVRAGVEPIVSSEIAVMSHTALYVAAVEAMVGPMLPDRVRDRAEQRMKEISAVVLADPIASIEMEAVCQIFMSDGRVEQGTVRRAFDQRRTSHDTAIVLLGIAAAEGHELQPPLLRRLTSVSNF